MYGSVGSQASWFGLKVQKCTLPPIVLPLTLMQPEILPLEICHFSFESLFFHKSFVKIRGAHILTLRYLSVSG